MWYSSNCSRLERCKKRHEPTTVVSATKSTRMHVCQETLCVSKSHPTQYAMCPDCARRIQSSRWLHVRHVVLLRMDTWCTKPPLGSCTSTASSDALRHHASAGSCKGCTRSGEISSIGACDILETILTEIRFITHLTASVLRLVRRSGTTRLCKLPLRARLKLARRINGAAQQNEERHDSGTARVTCRASEQSRSARVSLVLGALVFDCSSSPTVRRRPNGRSVRASLRLHISPLSTTPE